MRIKQIVEHFNFEGNFVNGFRYGSGHINETYVAVFKIDEHKYRRYLLQKINNNVFKNVEGLMKNIELVLDESHKQLLNEGKDPYIYSMTLVRTKDDKNHLNIDSEYWRAYFFVEEGLGFDLIENPKHFYESGVAFGKFQTMLKMFDVNEISDTIPNFHNTKVRYDHLLEAIKNDPKDRVKLVKDEIEFFKEREHYLTVITDLLNNEEMPYRVTHNDTKLNNVLINPISDEALCVIDLDTIMKGSVVYDFGDSIRFGASTATEDEIDLTKVNFSIELFEEFTKGFLKETKDTLEQIEFDHLAFGSILMTFEVGMRFLTDFINGDTYFRIKRENHNLDRARTQLKLVKEMELKLDEMKEIVNKYK